MKLEKFDYQIGNKKTKREFVALGVLCIALIVTVVLYKTFASFSSSASYTIISSRVGQIGATRNEVISIDISRQENVDDVHAILYDDNTLAIEGNGYMKDFAGTDLIGEVLSEYINQKNILSTQDLEFVSNHEKEMRSIFEIVGRKLFIVKDDNNLSDKINSLFLDENDQPIAADITTANEIADKVANAGFAIENIEISGDVKNIGDYAFNLKEAIAQGNTRYDLYEYDTKDYMNEDNVWETFGTVTLKANLESVGNLTTQASAVSDIYADSVVIEDGVTTIPNDLFAWYGDKIRTSSNVVKDNQVISIPNTVTSIGNRAFYLYKGSDLNIPSAIEDIEDYAFASYNGSTITIPSTITTLKANAFKDFTSRINMSTCPSDKAFAPNASVYANDTECQFN